jgi:hypothetical protein
VGQPPRSAQVVQLSLAKAQPPRSPECWAGYDASLERASPGSVPVAQRGAVGAFRSAGTRTRLCAGLRGASCCALSAAVATSVVTSSAHGKLAPAVQSSADREASTLKLRANPATRNRHAWTLAVEWLRMEAEQPHRGRDEPSPVKEFDYDPRSSPSRPGSWCALTALSP